MGISQFGYWGVVTVRVAGGIGQHTIFIYVQADAMSEFAIAVIVKQGHIAVFDKRIAVAVFFDDGLSVFVNGVKAVYGLFLAAMVVLPCIGGILACPTHFFTDGRQGVRLRGVFCHAHGLGLNGKTIAFRLFVAQSAQAGGIKIRVFAAVLAVFGAAGADFAQKLVHILPLQFGVAFGVLPGHGVYQFFIR